MSDAADQLEATRNATLKPDERSVAERFKTELEAEGKALASQLEEALEVKRGIALRIKWLRAEIEKNERTQKALVKRTRSN